MVKGRTVVDSHWKVGSPFRLIEYSGATINLRRPLQRDTKRANILPY